MTGDHGGHAHPIPQTAADELAALVDAVSAAACDGPVLVIADNAAIARSGPAWARVFAARGWGHRVRLSEGSDGDAAALEAEARALAAEARSLRATVIVGSGGEAPRAAARAAAALTGLPVVMSASMPAD